MAAKSMRELLAEQEAEKRKKEEANKPTSKPEAKKEQKPELKDEEKPKPEPENEEKPKPAPAPEPDDDDDEEDDYDEDNKRFATAGVIVAILIIVVLAATVFFLGKDYGLWGNGSSKKETPTVSENDPAEGAEVTATELAEDVSKARARGAQPVLMPDGEHYVYIEGITEETANNVDALLRYYESVGDIDPAEIEESNEHLYTVTLPRLSQSWNPEFNLIEAVLNSDTEATYNGTPIRDILSVEENRQYFYFEQDEVSGVYQASIMYYYLMGVWSELAEEVAGE